VRLPAYHHDGSPLYVSTQTPDLDDVVSVFVRGEVSSGVRRVFVRCIWDGEPRFTQAMVDRAANGEIWWRAEVPVRNLVNSYRFLLVGTKGYCWLNAFGVVPHDVPDDSDFRLVAHPAPPQWAADSIVYQIFPDRFARGASAHQRPAPDWAIRCDWDTPVKGSGPETPRQWYGGDLDGIAEHLDHITDLGANTVYLTPIFPARSNHRYDVASYDEVDPLLGGDKALDRLTAALRDRGVRLLGDLVTNHTGDAHPWFTGPDSRDFYYWNADGRYDSWLDVPTMPKLNWASMALRERFATDPNAVTRRWLEWFDGWRVDVANMTGRRGADDYTHEVAALLAGAVRASRRDGLLLAEHGHDASGDLDRGGWHGTMNYSGFTRPVWTWLRAENPDVPNFLGVPDGIPRCDGAAMVATMRSFASRMSWRSWVHSWSLLGSHDTPRVRTVFGDPDLVEVGVGLLATLPGTPMIFAGDELGMSGVNGEDGRRPMPWHRPQSWHAPTLRRYRALLRLRNDQHALRHGGLRFAHVDSDSVAYWREETHSRLLVLVRRAGGDPIRLAGVHGAVNLYGDAKLSIDETGALLPGDGPTVQVWACV
jgi:alpha-glucosidase